MDDMIIVVAGECDSNLIVKPSPTGYECADRNVTATHLTNLHKRCLEKHDLNLQDIIKVTCESPNDS